MIVAEHQLTLLFYIDNLLISHIYSQMVTNYIKRLDEIHGSNNPLSVTCRKLHEYLGMTLDFCVPSSCIFSQCNAIKKFWLSLPKELRGSYCMTLAPSDLVKIDPNAEKLDTRKKEEYLTFLHLDLS